MGGVCVGDGRGGRGEKRAPLKLVSDLELLEVCRHRPV
jgi:hypothetical protein